MSAIPSLIPLDWLIGLGAALIGALGIWFGGRKSAKQAAKIETLKDEVKAHETHEAVEDRVAAGGDARDGLRKRWQR